MTHNVILKVTSTKADKKLLSMPLYKNTDNLKTKHTETIDDRAKNESTTYKFVRQTQ